MTRLLYRLLLLLPNPPKPPMWPCSGCNAKNEDFRDRCRNCGGAR